MKKHWKALLGLAGGTVGLFLLARWAERRSVQSVVQQAQSYSTSNGINPPVQNPFRSMQQNFLPGVNVQPSVATRQVMDTTKLIKILP